MRKSDLAAGALLVNVIPHAVLGLTGKRELTPLGGADSSPAANIAWAAMDGLAAALLLRSGGWRAIDQPTAAERLAAVQTGVAAMAACGMAYELTLGRRARQSQRRAR
jgi:hypothetical protein